MVCGTPSIEKLESRRLLSADLRPVTAFLPQVVPDAPAMPEIYRDSDRRALVVVGTHGDDNLRIEIDSTEAIAFDGDVEVGRAELTDVEFVQVWALDGDDTVTVATGLRTWIEGGAGNDTLIGDSGSDTLVGGDGDDELFGNAGSDYLGGGTGDDVLFGDAGNDHLEAALGNDRLVAGEGNDAISGGLGRDGLDYSQRDVGFDIGYYGSSEQNAFRTLMDSGERPDLDWDALRAGLGPGHLYRTGSARAYNPYGKFGDGERIEGAPDYLDEKDELGPDIENILGGRAADQFRGPSRNVFFDGGEGADRYYNNFLDDDEVAFVEGEDEWWYQPPPSTGGFSLSPSL